MQIHLLFSSLLIACSEKTEETGDTDTGETVVTSDALFSYECYQEDGWCDHGRQIQAETLL